jgi:hypothetical protein
VAVPVALPNYSLTFGNSFLSNFQASLTSFCVPLFGAMSLHSKFFSESRVDTIQYAVFKGVFESFSFKKRKWSLVLRLVFVSDELTAGRGWRTQSGLPPGFLQFVQSSPSCASIRSGHCTSSRLSDFDRLPVKDPRWIRHPSC